MMNVGREGKCKFEFLVAIACASSSVSHTNEQIVIEYLNHIDFYLYFIFDVTASPQSCIIIV